VVGAAFFIKELVEKARMKKAATATTTMAGGSKKTINEIPRTSLSAGSKHEIRKMMQNLQKKTVEQKV
jgi:hypothetical protein